MRQKRTHRILWFVSVGEKRNFSFQSAKCIIINAIIAHHSHTLPDRLFYYSHFRCREMHSRSAICILLRFKCIFRFVNICDVFTLARSVGRSDAFDAAADAVIIIIIIIACAMCMQSVGLAVRLLRTQCAWVEEPTTICRPN